MTWAGEHPQSGVAIFTSDGSPNCVVGTDGDIFQWMPHGADFPAISPSLEDSLVWNGSQWAPSGVTGGGGGAGDVTGPDSSTNQAVVRFDGTTGTTLKDSSVLISNSGELVDIQTATFSSEVNLGNVATSVTVDWPRAQNQRIRLTGNATLTFIAPSGVSRLLLKLVQDGTGDRAPVWPSNVKWCGGAAPTLSSGNATDIISFYYDSINYHGVPTLDFF